jgi:CO/xanthine dehydrogenase Mo-binding subunit
MKRTLQSVAEKILGQKDLLFGDEKVYSLSHPEKCISFKALAKAAHLHGAPMVETAWHDITTQDVDPETAQGDAYAAYAFATQLAEVEVDTETGKVEILRVVTATDAGKAINPLNVEGQLEGGVAMGVGYALTEEITQRGGYLQTLSLGDYMIPTSLDVPPIETHIIEVPISTGPYGAKGVGEPASIPTAPAILNAIANALDIRVTELPASSENLLRLIREKEQGGKTLPHG